MPLSLDTIELEALRHRRALELAKAESHAYLYGCAVLAAGLIKVPLGTDSANQIADMGTRHYDKLLRDLP